HRGDPPLLRGVQAARARQPLLHAGHRRLRRRVAGDQRGPPELRRHRAPAGVTMRWLVHGERPLYQSEWVDLTLVDVEVPDGPRFEHHVVRMPAAAAATVVHDPDRGVLLLWRHRFVTDTWGWELPAGRIDDGETPEQAAARETL